jgi:squalene-hopene/tetraprenyl-beta-curcumene cyclase
LLKEIRIMKKKIAPSLSLLLISIVLLQVISPALADVSINITCNIADVNSDNFPDLLFTAKDALGNPQAGIRIDLIAENMTIPLIFGSTDLSGTVVFKNVPAGNYTWVSSSGQTDKIEIKPCDIELSEEDEALINFLLLEWCANSEAGNNGLSILNGLAEMTGFSRVEKNESSNNYLRAIHYYSWLSKLVEHIDSKSFSNRFMKISKTMIYGAESSLSVLGKISQDALTPPSLQFATDGYKMNYLIDRVYVQGGLRLPRQHIFAARIGLQGLALIVLGVADLLVFQNTEFDVEVPLPEETITKTINVGMAFCRIADGLSQLALSVGRLFFKMGAKASNYLCTASRLFGIAGCILSMVMIMLDICSQYATWKPVLENLLNPDIALSVAELVVTAAAAAYLFAPTVFVPIVGWIVFGAIIIVTIARIMWDYVKNYWAEVDYAKEFVSQVADKVMSIRDILKRYNVDDLIYSSTISRKVHLLASSLAQDVSGKIKDDLNWASQYFNALSEAQLDLAETISPLEQTTNELLVSILHYDSPDGKKVRGHLEGVNCTDAQYLTPGASKFFSFRACVYHESKVNPGQFVYDKAIVKYNETTGETQETYEEVDYSYISRSGWHIPYVWGWREGWAWEVPVEKDSDGRTFAATYTTDINHLPTGQSTNFSFYFDSGCQNYDPDSEFRRGARLATDPPSFYFHYKFFFDEGTTEEYWGLGRPDALNEWRTNIYNKLPDFDAKVKSFEIALNAFIGALSRKRGFISPTTEKGLKWLRGRQSSDGSWRGNVGVTSFSTLAFLNAGFDEQDPTVKNGISYILSKVRADGSIYSSSSWATYETSLALLPLVATRNVAYNTVIENAKNWLVRCQWDEGEGITKDDWRYGGFGYYIGSRPDLSNTQFAALALEAAGLPKDHPLWSKLQVFLHRCQKVNFPINVTIDCSVYTVQPWNYAGTTGGYDGGFVYLPGDNPYYSGGEPSMGAMTGAGIWCLLLAGVSKADRRVTEAINWVINHYTWDTNPNSAGYRRYYYYLTMAKALTMYGEKIIGGHDWYQELSDKITSEMIAVGDDKAYWNPLQEDFGPELPTAYAILSLQTRVTAPTIQRLSYLTFILRSNCLLKIISPEGEAVGYNYLNGRGENQIPTAIYSGPFAEPQYIVIVNPQAGTYRLELIGISEGWYELTIQGNYGEEVTDTFTFQGEIKPGELHGTDVTVTAIVGPIDVYANPPEFQEIIDNIPPTTPLEIGEPKYADLTGDIYVSSITPFTLTAEDNPGGTGVASTFYRIYNSTYDTGWLEYSVPFYLTGLSDGEYSIDYYSTDNIGNVEPTNTATVILDNTPPTTTLTIGEPKYVSCITYVTPDTPFILEAEDAGAGVNITNYRIYNSTYDSGWITYTSPFYLTSLADGTYTIEYYSIDNVQNAEVTQAINITLFSWNYIFEDTYGRGTTLKINLANKFFQFITPDKDYGIRNATYMRQCGRAIIIQHSDKELRLITVAVDTKLDFCVAIAWDLQTRKQYFLIDKAGKE